jgi:DNA-binding protein H-NS
MEVNEFVKIAMHRKRLKAAVKELNMEQLNKLANDISEIVVEREQEISEMAAEQKAKLAKIEEMRSMLSEQGLTVEDLVDGETLLAPKKTSGRTVKPKYRVIDEDGQEHLWTGRGRAPKAFQKKLDQGLSKDSFLI